MTKKKPRIDPFFEIFEQMRREMEDMMRGFMSFDDDIFEELSKNKGKSKVYGVHITVGPDGKPIVKEFGNVPRKTVETINEESDEDKLEMAEAREPLVETHKDGDELVIVAEVPGVRKEDINLELVEDDVLEIKADTEKHKYYKKLKLPAEVDDKSIKASYKNGILEVRVKIRKEKKAKRKKHIKVE